jgi:pimeloyl-ACP methyl ester carboxylesterase
MNCAFRANDGAALSGMDTGNGLAAIFQHGLGGDEAQIAEAFPPHGFRRLTLECRAQGKSESGNHDRFSIPQFAEDVLAFAGSRGVKRFAAGGISMGAAIALRLAVVAPEHVRALILVRPAWGWNAAPDNMRAIAELGPFLRRGDRAGFEASSTAQYFASHAPDNLSSLLRFFDRPDHEITAELLERIAASGPDIAESEVRGLRVPTLVIANAVDLIHPVALAQSLAAAIPGAKCLEVTPKANDRAKHARELRVAIADFLTSLGVTT